MNSGSPAPKQKGYSVSYFYESTEEVFIISSIINDFAKMKKAIIALIEINMMTYNTYVITIPTRETRIIGDNRTNRTIVAPDSLFIGVCVSSRS